MMLAFVTVGLTTYQLTRVPPEEMDRLVVHGDPARIGPEFYDDWKRVWPPAREGMRVFFYDAPQHVKRGRTE